MLKPGISNESLNVVYFFPNRNKEILKRKVVHHVPAQWSDVGVYNMFTWPNLIFIPATYCPPFFKKCIMGLQLKNSTSQYVYDKWLQ